MPLPTPADADPRDRSTSLAHGAALAAALLATAAMLALALRLWLQDGTAAAPAQQLWLVGAGMACAGAALGWLIWRQSALAGDLRAARVEVAGWRDLIDACQWRSDATHRLTMLRPPPTAAEADWAAADALGQTVWDHFGAEADAAAALRARMGNGAPLDRLTLSRRLGARRGEQVELCAVPLTDARGRPAGYLGVARAVQEATTPATDRDLLQAMLLALPFPAFLLDGDAAAPARVTGASDAASEWLGGASETLVGHSWHDLQERLPADLRAPVSRALAAVVGGAERPVCLGWEVRIQRLEAEPRRSDAPTAVNPSHWLLTLIAKAPATAPLAPPSSSAAAAAEHESFSYTVSHDLRAPIRVVEGFTKILKEDYGRQLDRIGNDHLDRVLGAAARMNSMIDALLALSQLSARPLARQPVNLTQLATYVIEDLRRQSPERAVSVHIAPGLQAQGDPTLVRMVLENLLGNAWKYSAKRPHAEISLDKDESEGQPVFSVRDNGAGFDMRFADRLFGVFQRLHSATDFPGTGVGLASVRRIVSRHGGEVWAESAVERGSAFHFTLPSPGAAD